MSAPFDQQPIIHFHPYQRAWLNDVSRFKIGMFARQTGKTYTTCAEIVDDCIQHEIRGERTRWVILSRSERQAAEAMDEGIKPFCKVFYLVYQALLSGKAAPTFSVEDWPAIGEDGRPILKDDGTPLVYKALEVRFPSGSRITALPANADTARGYSANVFLDEFAFHKDSRAIWKALFPIVSKGGLKLRITSTPNGKDNKFYELWTAEDTVWSRHRVDIYEAVAQGLDRDVEALRAAGADEDAWAQEFELEFLEAAGAWLSYEDIMGCEDPDAGKPGLYLGGDCYIGNDIARRKDLWVAWVNERVGDVFWTREIVTLQKASFAAQDAEIARLMNQYNVARLVMDQTGMGEKPVEDAKAQYGGKVVGVHLQGAVRYNVASVAKQCYEDRKHRIPAGDIVLRADLHKIKKVVGETGMPRLIADRDSAGHADRAWADFMSLAGADPLVVKSEDGMLDYLRRLAAEAVAAASKEPRT
jgi:phage FluMu gp28-like protein